MDPYHEAVTYSPPSLGLYVTEGVVIQDERKNSANISISRFIGNIIQLLRWIMRGKSGRLRFGRGGIGSDFFYSLLISPAGSPHFVKPFGKTALFFKVLCLGCDLPVEKIAAKIEKG